MNEVVLIGKIIIINIEPKQIFPSSFPFSLPSSACLSPFFLRSSDYCIHSFHCPLPPLSLLLPLFIFVPFNLPSLSSFPPLLCLLLVFSLPSHCICSFSSLYRPFLPHMCLYLSPFRFILVTPSAHSQHSFLHPPIHNASASFPFSSLSPFSFTTEA